MGSISEKKTLNLGVPEGSILGPDEYSDFTNPVGDFVRANGIHPLFYADASNSSE
jgi:hypothetical protein